MPLQAFCQAHACTLTSKGACSYGKTMEQCKVILVSALKGGVGKTTISAGLARALVSKGFKVGALDADYRTPNLHIALSCTGKPTRGKGDTVVPPQVDGIKVLSWSMIWPDDSAVMIEDSQIEPEDLRHAVVLIKTGRTEAAIKYMTELANHPGGASEHMRLLFEPGAIDWGDIDFLVIDTPPESTGTVRVVAESGGVFGGILVCHPSKVSMADLRRTVDLFKKKEVPIIGVVSNQGSQNGVARYDLSDDDIIQFSKERGIPFITSIPHTTELDSYLDKVADFVMCCSPVVLKVKQVDESAVAEKLKSITKLVNLMEAFK